MIRKHRLDFIIIGSILLFAFIFVLIIKLTQKEGKYVVVIFNQTEKSRYLLDEDLEVKLSFGDDKYNILVIKDGKASIKSASCPDQICVRQRSISKVGETITCLPNKTVIKIVGDKSEVDVVS
ncbi:MAG: NusG domain II-containing protein [Bacilli bacterium]|jgi:hypothetical protein|nr:NusG domain II-containing protein [Staphylococcus sp.]